MSNLSITHPLPQNISGLSFQGMNCTGWDFSGRDIRGCNFNHAKLNGANFNGVVAGKSKEHVRLYIISIFVGSFIFTVLPIVAFILGVRSSLFPFNLIFFS